MLINVDFDGVIVPNIYEESLLQKVSEENISMVDTSPIWNWYEKMLKQPLPLNTSLLTTLNGWKERGNYIRVWTNRMYTLKQCTINNLGEYKNIFDSFNFYSGRKKNHLVEGIVIDNLLENLKCGEIGILYNERR